MTLIQGSQGIDGLFSNLFSFLRRKTDYFAQHGEEPLILRARKETYDEGVREIKRKIFEFTSCQIREIRGRVASTTGRDAQEEDRTE